jgi:hypothetical protein
MSSGYPPLEPKFYIYRERGHPKLPLQNLLLHFLLAKPFECLRWKDFIPPDNMGQNAQNLDCSKPLTKTCSRTREEWYDYGKNQFSANVTSAEGRQEMDAQAPRGHLYVGVSINRSGLKSSASSPQYRSTD